VTGKPVWPIEERLFPRAMFPVKRVRARSLSYTPAAAFAARCYTRDAFDLTPGAEGGSASRAEEISNRTIFTPPSLQGTVMRPGIIGGANWGGAHSILKPECYTSRPRIPRTSRGWYNPRSLPSRMPSTRWRRIERDFPRCIPLLKPPYGHLSAINLNTGELRGKCRSATMPGCARIPL